MESLRGTDLLRAVDHVFYCVDLVTIWTFTSSVYIDSFIVLLLIHRRGEAAIFCVDMNIQKILFFFIYFGFRGEV